MKSTGYILADSQVKFQIFFFISEIQIPSNSNEYKTYDAPNIHRFYTLLQNWVILFLKSYSYVPNYFATFSPCNFEF